MSLNFSLDEFLSKEGEDFVTEAYALILERAPDASGLAHGVKLVGRSGRKIRYLMGLLRSEEAKGHAAVELLGPQVEALLRRVSMPIIGRFKERAIIKDIVTKRLTTIAPEAELSLSPEVVHFFPLSKSGHYHLETFYRFYDKALVHAAYWALIGQGPDQFCETYWCQRLDQGESRAFLLHLLAKSTPAKARSVTVGGLSLIYGFERLLLIPVIGDLLGVLALFGRFRAMTRQIRQLENALFKQNWQNN